MEPTEQFQYVNNLYSTRSKTPMISTASHTNLEVMRHLQRAAESPPKKPRTESTNGNRQRRDHLDEMWQGVSFGARHVNSSYRLGFGQTPAMQEALREKDYQHHIKRDFIKEYAEAMCKHTVNSRAPPPVPKPRK